MQETSESEDDDEIEKIMGHRTDPDNIKKHTIYILWNSGNKETSSSIAALVSDAWVAMFEYAKKRVQTHWEPDKPFLEEAIRALKRKARAQQKVEARDLEKTFKQTFEAKDIASLEDEPTEDISTEKQANMDKICSHIQCDLEEEIHPGNCKGGNKLDGKSCVNCNRRMVDKGKNHDGKGNINTATFKPGPLHPVYMCMNILECGYVICRFCVATKISEKDAVGGRSSRRRNN